MDVPITRERVGRPALCRPSSRQRSRLQPGRGDRAGVRDRDQQHLFRPRQRDLPARAADRRTGPRALHRLARRERSRRRPVPRRVLGPARHVDELRAPGGHVRDVDDDRRSRARAGSGAGRLRVRRDVRASASRSGGGPRLHGRRRCARRRGRRDPRPRSVADALRRRSCSPGPHRHRERPADHDRRHDAGRVPVPRHGGPVAAALNMPGSATAPRDRAASRFSGG